MIGNNTNLGRLKELPASDRIEAAADLIDSADGAIKDGGHVMTDEAKVDAKHMIAVLRGLLGR